MAKSKGLGLNVVTAVAIVCVGPNVTIRLGLTEEKIGNLVAGVSILTIKLGLLCVGLSVDVGKSEVGLGAGGVILPVFAAECIGVNDTWFLGKHLEI